MRLKLQAEPGELSHRGGALLTALAKAVHDEAPELAAVLEKAIPLPGVPDQMAYPVLQRLRELWVDEYERQMGIMLGQIGEVLDRAAEGGGVAKSTLRERQDARERLRASMPEAKVKPGKCPPHQWDRGGERCLKCGDKDWM